MSKRWIAAVTGRVQRLGGFLAAMVGPNIAAFLAWGFLTALFIPAGWYPNARLAALVEPTLLQLLPLLIGFTGGRLVHGTRGGVVGALATMGMVAGSSIPMFLGAMVAGPVGGWTVKQCDRLLAKRIPVGFEMLAANFSGGLLGLGLMIAAYTVVGPFVAAVTHALGAGAQWVTQRGLLPLAALFIEPAKLLFMNNAINHGLLSPLGAAQVKEAGKSVFFLLETNPGPGLGLLAAYWIAGKGVARNSAPGAALVHFFGGIHEIYFPYALMNPLTAVALVAGGFAANLVFVSLHAGLVGVPSPGSIFAQIAMTPPGGLGAVLAGVATGAIVSCAVAAPIVRRAAAAGVSEEEAAAPEPSPPRHAGASSPAPRRMPTAIVFACEAGMGSSAMGASVLRMKLKKAGLQVPVRHAALNDIPNDAEMIISHQSLVPRVLQAAPAAAVHGVDDFLKSPVYDELVEQLQSIRRESGEE